MLSFILVLAEIPRETWATSATLSLASGAAALALMGASALLGGRFKIIESAFGGLDRVYLTHKWLGIWALAFATFHFVFEANLKVWHGESIIDLPPDLARLARQLSYAALVLIILLALNRKIPYYLWRWWHKLSGPLFAIVVVHWLSIKSPIKIDSPVGIWLAVLSSLGLAAAAYKLLLYPLLSNHADYRIVGVYPGTDAVHLELAPTTRAIDFQPGQFGFMTIMEPGFREPHPFTIANASEPNGHVHFMIRALGDYTQRLVSQVTIGMCAEVYAPYGRFERLPASQREIWIAGGVGISPFIAWAKDLSAGGFDKITLFYFFTPGRDFPGVESLTEMIAERGGEFIPISTGASSSAFKRRFCEIVQENGPKIVDVSFCGPTGLLKRVRSEMEENGVPGRNLQFEHFEFR